MLTKYQIRVTSDAWRVLPKSPKGKQKHERKIANKKTTERERERERERKIKVKKLATEKRKWQQVVSVKCRQKIFITDFKLMAETEKTKKKPEKTE